MTASNTVLGSPYRSATLAVRCDQKGDARELDVYLLFDYFNLPGGDPKSLRVKFDDETPTDWGVSGMSASRRGVFMDSSVLLAERAEATTFAIRMTYFNHGPVTVRFDGNGSAVAIGTVLGSDCGRWQLKPRGAWRGSANANKPKKTNWFAAAQKCSKFIPIVRGRGRTDAEPQNAIST